MRTEAALHLVGRATSWCGLALLVPLAIALLAPAAGAASSTTPWALGASSCLAVGWGLRFACDAVPGALDARATRLLLAGGGLFAALLALLPWLLAAGRE